MAYNFLFHNVVITVVPIAIIGAGYYLLARFRRRGLSKAVHAGFSMTIAVLSVWGAYQLWDVATSGGGMLSGMIMIYWVVFGVPVAVGCFILVWSVVTLTSYRPRAAAGEPSASRTGRNFALGFISLAMLGLIYYSYSYSQLSIAANESSEPERLRTSYNSWYAGWDSEIHRKLARNKSTPEDVLRLLARHEDWYVRDNICFNDATPLPLLIMLAKDKAWQVRSCVARHSDPKYKLLMQLGNNQSMDFRSHTVYNKALPPELMMQLGRDSHEQVRRVLAMNEGAPVEVLAVLAADNVDAVRGLVARRKDLPLELRLKLAEDKSVNVRRHLLTWLDVPLEVLNKLENDPDERIRKSVQFRYEGQLRKEL